MPLTTRTLSLLSVIALSVLLTACSESAPTAKDNAVPARPVKWITVADPAGKRLRQFPAVLEASEVAQLTFRVSGELKQLPVHAGSHVQQGELVAKLDPTDYQLVVDQAKARYQLASSQYQRSKNLVAQGLMSEAQFDEVSSQLAVAKSNYETAQANLRYSELRAPFSGTIAHLYVENYENIQAKQPIATLQISDAIDVSIQVPENLFAKVSRQPDYQPVVIFDAAPDQHFSASLKEWDTQADPATNTYKVVLTMAKPEDLNVLPGMSATVVVDLRKVIQNSDQAIVIPASAVFSPTDGGKHYVWRVTANNTVDKVAVEVGPMSNEGIEIRAGLNPGDKVVIAGVHQLQNGQQVREWTRERGL